MLHGQKTQETLTLNCLNCLLSDSEPERERTEDEEREEEEEDEVEMDEERLEPRSDDDDT